MGGHGRPWAAMGGHGRPWAAVTPGLEFTVTRGLDRFPRRDTLIREAVQEACGRQASLWWTG